MPDPNTKENIAADNFIGSFENPINLPSSRLCLWAAVAVLSINAVSGHIYGKNEASAVNIASISMQDIMEQGKKDFMAQGLSNERAMLNVAYLLDYVQEEVDEIERSGVYSLVIDRNAVVFGTTEDLTFKVYTDAMRGARLSMTEEGFLTRKMADAAR